MRDSRKLVGAVAVAAAMVFVAPVAAQAVVTVQLGGRSCTSGAAPYVHITSETKGTVVHYHHLTGAANYSSTSWVNSSWATRVSSKNYRSETSMYLTVNDGGSISTYGTSCDN